MIKINYQKDRGHRDYGWLNANYSFSFGEYFNPQKMGFESLRVINEDFVQPLEGFPPHGHKNMEIITFVISGELTHRDSMGNVASLKPGRIQRMYAGKGVTHSEYNASKDTILNLLQIWVIPNALNLPSEYNELEFDLNSEQQLLASGSGRENSIKIYQDTELKLLNLKNGKPLELDLGTANYFHIIKGKVRLPDGSLAEYGDSIEISELNQIKIVPEEDTQVLFFKF